MPQDNVESEKGREEDIRKLAQRVVHDLNLVRRRVNGSTYEDGYGQLFTVLYPKDTGGIKRLLDHVFDDVITLVDHLEVQDGGPR